MKAKNLYLVKRLENKDIPEIPRIKKQNPMEKKFQIKGYRLMGYDATWEKTTFEYIEVRHDGSRTIEVEELNSAIRFCIEIKDK